MRAVVVIPAFNEERTVGAVVQRVREYIPDVLVIDDGSSDATADRARAAGAAVVRHAVNRGLGAALGTGIAAAIGGVIPPPPAGSRGHGGKQGDLLSESRDGQGGVGDAPDILVTLDADGQHDPADIPALIAPIERGEADVVIGTRFGLRRGGASSPPVEIGTAVHKRGRPLGAAPTHTAPHTRVLANRTANLITRALFGVQCSDTQSGFRALSRHAAEQLDLRTNRMEVSSEILAEAARLHLRITEVPIRTIYTEYSLSKGQSPTVGMRTAWGLVMRRLL